MHNTCMCLLTCRACSHIKKCEHVPAYLKYISRNDQLKSLHSSCAALALVRKGEPLALELFPGLRPIGSNGSGRITTEQADMLVQQMFCPIIDALKCSDGTGDYLKSLLVPDDNHLPSVKLCYQQGMCEKTNSILACALPRVYTQTLGPGNLTHYRLWYAAGKLSWERGDGVSCRLPFKN
jgi:hypothetical protein